MFANNFFSGSGSLEWLLQGHLLSHLPPTLCSSDSHVLAVPSAFTSSSLGLNILALAAPLLNSQTLSSTQLPSITSLIFTFRTKSRRDYVIQALQFKSNLPVSDTPLGINQLQNTSESFFIRSIITSFNPSPLFSEKCLKLLWSIVTCLQEFFQFHPKSLFLKNKNLSF